MDLFMIDTKGGGPINEDSSENEEESAEEEVESEDESETEPTEDLGLEKQHRGIVDNSSSTSEESDDSESNSDIEETVLYNTPQRNKVVRPGSLSHVWKYGLGKQVEEDTTTVKEEDDDCIIVPRGPSDEEDEDDDRIITEIPKLLEQTKITSEVKKKKKKKKKGDYNLGDAYIDFTKNKFGVINHKASETLKEARKDSIHKLLEEKSVAHKPGFEQLEAVPSAYLPVRKLKKLRKAEREKTKGKEWFNLPATEVTEEVKHDLEVLQMRSVLDPKTFYKKNDLKVLPKYFQVGRVEDSAADFYNSRIPKKDRKRTMVDELLADAEFQKRSKQKFKEIVQEKKQTETRAYRHAKKLKRKKK